MHESFTVKQNKTKVPVMQWLTHTHTRCKTYSSQASSMTRIECTCTCLWFSSNLWRYKQQSIPFQTTKPGQGAGSDKKQKIFVFFPTAFSFLRSIFLFHHPFRLPFPPICLLVASVICTLDRYGPEEIKKKEEKTRRKRESEEMMKRFLGDWRGACSDVTWNRRRDMACLLSC